MSDDTLTRILDLARWAPSGDNTQPWRFEILGSDRVAVHGFDTRDWCVYDFRGHASHIAHGALLETMRLAATQFSMRTRWSLREGPDTSPVYEVHFEHEAGLQADPLAAFIERRTVQRRPMQTTPLRAEQRQALSNAAGENYRMVYLETLRERWRMAGVLWESARLRLTCPEAYETHRQIIEWGESFSEDRIPERAVGTDVMTGRLMHWVLQSWDRVQFFNRYLMGTWAPRIQLDLVPAMACAAHFVMMPTRSPDGILSYIDAGAALQRVWLTATAQGLHLQPEMTPLIFRWYVRSDARISTDGRIDRGALAMAGRLEHLLSVSQDQAFLFMGRVGIASVPNARSMRLPLPRLMRSGFEES